MPEMDIIRRTLDSPLNLPELVEHYEQLIPRQRQRCREMLRRLGQCAGGPGAPEVSGPMVEVFAKGLSPNVRFAVALETRAELVCRLIRKVGPEVRVSDLARLSELASVPGDAEEVRSIIYTAVSRTVRTLMWEDRGRDRHLFGDDDMPAEGLSEEEWGRAQAEFESIDAEEQATIDHTLDVLGGHGFAGE